MKTHIFLTFDGTANAAIAFYGEVLGAKVLEKMHFAEMPDTSMVPDNRLDDIAHAVLDLGGQSVMLADAVNLDAYVVPRGFHIQTEWADLSEANGIFDRLAQDGEIHMPFAPTFWAAGFGVVRDKFNIPWMVNCSAKD